MTQSLINYSVFSVSYLDCSIYCFIIEDGNILHMYVYE